MKLAAIIVAAGSSQRMGFDKLMHPLINKPVLQHALDAFQNHEQVARVIVVTPISRFEQLDAKPHVECISGGQERHVSVVAGLGALSSDITHVAVHDGARPLISKEQIQKVFEAAKLHKAATSAKLITDTVKRGSHEEFTAEAVSRELLWAMETPQIFEISLLRKAYQLVTGAKGHVTDEVSALEELNIPTKLIQNTTPNPKITFPEDLLLAESLYQASINA